MHAIAEEAEIADIEGKVDKQSKKTLKATFLRPGETGKIVIAHTHTARLRIFICRQSKQFRHETQAHEYISKRIVMTRKRNPLPHPP